MVLLLSSYLLVSELSQDVLIVTKISSMKIKSAVNSVHVPGLTHSKKGFCSGRFPS